MIWRIFLFYLWADYCVLPGATQRFYCANIYQYGA